MGGGGGLIAKLSEEKYEAELIFPGDEGVQNKKPSVGMDIFCNYTQQEKCTQMNLLGSYKTSHARTAIWCNYMYIVKLTCHKQPYKNTCTGREVALLYCITIMDKWLQVND